MIKVCNKLKIFDILIGNPNWLLIDKMPCYFQTRKKCKKRSFSRFYFLLLLALWSLESTMKILAERKEKKKRKEKLPTIKGSTL